MCLCVCQVSHYSGPGDLSTSWTGNCQEQKQICSLQRFCSDMAAEGTFIHIQCLVFVLFLFYKTRTVLIISHIFSLRVSLLLSEFLASFSRTVWAATVAQRWLLLWVQQQTTMKKHCQRYDMQTEQRTLWTMLLLTKTPTLASSGSSERK